MGKVITSPVPRWPGSVTLFESLSLPQVAAWQAAVEAAEALRKDTGAPMTSIEAAVDARLALAMLPGILACIEQCELKGLPPHLTEAAFPGSPRKSAQQLAAWLIGEINRVVTEETEIPKE